MTADQLSVGGLVVAIVAVVVTIAYWWRKEQHNYKLLVPWVSAMAVGSLWTACAGGLLGLGSGAIASGANAAGGLGLSGGTGTEAGDVAAGQMQDLSPAGAGVTIIATAVWILMLKIGTKGATVKLVTGAIIGASLALTPLVAGWADSTSVAAANGLGAWVVNAFQGWS